MLFDGVKLDDRKLLQGQIRCVAVVNVAVQIVAQLGVEGVLGPKSVESQLVGPDRVIVVVQVAVKLFFKIIS